MEGYLIHHSSKKPSKVRYCRLEHGYLRFYASHETSAKQTEEFRLSGCKVDVKAQARTDKIPFSFFVEAQRVLVKDRSYALAPKEIVEMSAGSPEGRSAWGKAILTWQRRYFQEEDAMTEIQHEHERLRLEEALHVYQRPAPAASTSTTPTQGFRMGSLRKSISSMLESLTSRAKVDDTCFDSHPPHPVAIA
ncbi:unnamed protein product [Aphanomyces euteiches]|uniref:PH domain-containing protein n=1 Tax=Aphanomyces euteiches TaxID=100861 RepID=A0A6G0X8M7_9STRA|nr:hypothetical protein Ae201684_007420 [Aphanomyces euteiches]KAH9100677.1 hypothetical protein Ae201684P_006872 [Aphanomyces euteiches]KAH9120966.1 hypothetical protein AeMF1_007104 [Aphanomyces euteiches]KAH9120983.1 hypothetical protein AeMF1_007085 [Aphanomyces euteiches]KAH9135171.1 hypothetical protein LEN26_006538 [Aphanomyces euteiches]